MARRIIFEHSKVLDTFFKVVAASPDVEVDLDTRGHCLALLEGCKLLADRKETYSTDPSRESRHCSKLALSSAQLQNAVARRGKSVESQVTTDHKSSESESTGMLLRKGAVSKWFTIFDNLVPIPSI